MLRIPHLLCLGCLCIGVHYLSFLELIPHLSCTCCVPQREFGFKLDRPVLADDVRVRGTGRSKALPGPPDAVPEPGVGGDGDRMRDKQYQIMTQDLIVPLPRLQFSILIPSELPPLCSPFLSVSLLASGLLLSEHPSPRGPLSPSPLTPTISQPHPTSVSSLTGPLPEPELVSSTFFELGGRQPTPVYKLPTLQPKHKVGRTLQITIGAVHPS